MYNEVSRKYNEVSKKLFDMTIQG